MTEQKPIVPVSPEDRERLLVLPGLFIIGKPPQANAWQGYIENSWTMGWSIDHVNFWDAKYRDDAKDHLKTAHKNHPDWEIKIVDCHADDLEINCDWEKWIDAQAYNPNTLSGVSNKFKARNVPFVMKD